MLAEKYATEIHKILAKYPPEERRAAVMPLLHLVQQEQMYIDRKSITDIAEILGMSTTEVASIIGFYSLYYDRPGGRYRLQICTDLPCALRGADQFMEELCQRLGIKPGETTPDGLLTIEPVMCLAACDKAPMFQLQSSEGLTYYEHQAVENTLELIETLRSQASQKVGGDWRDDHE
jgi:NADH-quinone oxidoreductase subunit E